MFALSACLVLAVPTATLSLAFKLLPGRLPAGTAKFEFQRTVPNIAQVNRGRNAHDARIHLHPSWRFGWSILSPIEITHLNLCFRCLRLKQETSRISNSKKFETQTVIHCGVMRLAGSDGLSRKLRILSLKLFKV